MFEVSSTVLAETRLIAGVETRVVEERETVNGELVELSLNFYALCRNSGDVFYFGEEVELLEGGVVVSGEGSWQAGVNGAVPGIELSRVRGSSASSRVSTTEPMPVSSCKRRSSPVAGSALGSRPSARRPVRHPRGPCSA